MNNKQYDFVVFIGRFQPPHKAHINIIEQAYEHTDNVIVLLGCADQPRTIKNSWTTVEREAMVRSAVTLPRPDCTLSCGPVRDFIYNDQQWAAYVQFLVSEQTKQITDDPMPSIALIGHTKDETSYYLKMFPQWPPIEARNIPDLHATNIRESLFTQDVESFDENVGQFLPDPIHDYLKAFTFSAPFEQLRNEFEFIERYKSAWKSAPYAPIFVTADAVVIQSGHVLLVRRRSEPGKGLWAISGGFVNADERVLDAAIRELKEETRIDCPIPVLKGSVKDTHVFDHPDRSLRGRTITHATFIELPSGKLHKVKGSDDAEKAKWIPINAFQKMEDQMFEDHFQIINYFLGQA